WRSCRELTHAGLLTVSEARTVIRKERFISDLRVRLHYLTGRREDRLGVDQQNALAAELGFVDIQGRLASEQLMQRYYRAAKLVPQGQINHPQQPPSQILS